MSSNKFINEIIISITFIILLVLFLNPFSLWMPHQLVYVMVAGLLVLFAVYASFIWRERPEDEREQLHSMIAGRAGYLMGITALTVAIVFQSVTAAVDLWLVIVLAGMVLAKIGGLIYSRKKH